MRSRVSWYVAAKRRAQGLSVEALADAAWLSECSEGGYAACSG